MQFCIFSLTLEVYYFSKSFLLDKYKKGENLRTVYASGGSKPITT